MKKAILFLIFPLLLVSCGNKKVAKDDGVFYTCSMDPQVISDKPGSCPICGMPLTAIKKSSIENSDDITLSDQQIQLGNIKVDTIGKAGMENQLEFTGVLNLNAAQTATVSARIMGRIEKLYVKTTGDYISKGAPLYEIYSEELNNAKQEYIAALQRRTLFKEQSVINFEDLIESARNKLRLWGMTDGQVRALETVEKAPTRTTFYSSESGFVTSLGVTEGGYVMEGGIIVELANLSTLWAEAQVYTSQLYSIPANATARVRINEFGMEMQGKVEFSNPEISTDTRINLLRVVIPNKENKLRPGMPVLVTVQTARRNSLALPTDAIIREANGATVWLLTGPNKFRSKMVTLGTEGNGMAEITSGLAAGDVVVTSGTYLLHSEYTFKKGTDPMAGHNH